jgi:hypothetical protein
VQREERTGNHGEAEAEDEALLQSGTAEDSTAASAEEGAVAKHCVPHLEVLQAEAELSKSAAVRAANALTDLGRRARAGAPQDPRKSAEAVSRDKR